MLGHLPILILHYLTLVVPRVLAIVRLLSFKVLYSLPYLRSYISRYLTLPYIPCLTLLLPNAPTLPYSTEIMRTGTLKVCSMNSDSNWVDCHVNSGIYLLLYLLASFPASQLVPFVFRPGRQREKRYRLFIQAPRKAGLALSQQGLQGRIGVAERVEECR